MTLYNIQVHWTSDCKATKHTHAVSCAINKILLVFKPTGSHNVYATSHHVKITSA